MNCETCERISKNTGKVFDIGDIVVMTAPEPATYGHCVVVSKQHATIIEQLPAKTIGAMFEKANKLAVALFETNLAQGTNLLIQNGIAAGQKHNHAMIHVIPRVQDDMMNFGWQPKQLPEDEMGTAELKLKDAINAPEEKKEEKKEEPKKEIIEDLKYFERIP